jgi:membrane associated rhomboid family serine protease
MAWRAEWETPERQFGFGGGRGGSFFSHAPITRTLLLLCVGVTLLSLVARNWIGAGDPTAWLALSLDNAPFVYPFFTYVFPHSTYNPLHIILNMLMLWWLGQELESRLGKTRYLTLFFGAAVFGALAHLAFTLALREARGGMLMGASGGVFALIFFIARETPSRPFFFYFVQIPARVLAFLLLVLEVWPLLFGRFDADGVAHACHLAGAAYGFVWQRHPFDAFAALDRARGVLRERAAERTAANESADDAEMDRLLRKIHDQGMPSLTASERRFLEERSRALKRRPPGSVDTLRDPP